MTLRGIKLKSASRTALSLGAGCRGTVGVTDCRLDLYAAKTADLRRRAGRVRTGHVNASVRLLRYHINTEMVGYEGDPSTRNLGGDFLGCRAAHVINDGTFLGDSVGDRQGHGDVTVYVNGGAAVDQLHIVQTAAVPDDGERRYLFFQIGVAFLFRHAEFRSLGEGAAIVDYRRAVCGIGDR